MSTPETAFWAQSSYGARTRQPIVVLRHQDWVLQVSPEEAREIALSILEAAESARSDAFLVEWVKASCGADDEGAARLLHEFRNWRKAHAGA